MLSCRGCGPKGAAGVDSGPRCRAAPPFVCSTCDGPAGEGGLLEFIMQKPIRDDGSIVCWLCASRLDPTLYRAFEKLGTSPLADLHSCQSPLWHDPELPKKLAAE